MRSITRYSIRWTPTVATTANATTTLFEDTISMALTLGALDQLCMNAIRFLSADAV
jgi:hypothetical protein